MFFIPILIGAVKPFSKYRFQRSLSSLFDGAEFIAAFFLALYFTRKLFIEDPQGIYLKIHGFLPQHIKAFLQGQGILTYAIAIPVLMMIISILLRAISNLFFNTMIIPLSETLDSSFDKAGSVLKAFVGILLNLPKAIYIPLVFVVVLNIVTHYYYEPTLNKWINESQAYQAVYERAVLPMVNSRLARQIPVLLKDSFKNAVEVSLPAAGIPGVDVAGEGSRNSSRPFGIKVIEYFNGVTLDDAIRSNKEIDETASKIVGNEKDTKKKAYLIYKWISRNIEYDQSKADKIIEDSKGISSGSIPAFETKKGICFDYSCLFISMCRAQGIKVRLVTGLGYSGVSWGDHAWNQIYYPDEKRWINVDSTFGCYANYFDNPGFDMDHKYAEIQGEW